MHEIPWEKIKVVEGEGDEGGLGGVEPPNLENILAAPRKQQWRMIFGIIEPKSPTYYNCMSRSHSSIT